MTFTEQFKTATFDWRCGPGQISRLFRLRSRYLASLSDLIMQTRGVRPSEKEQVLRIREFAVLIGYDGPVFVEDDTVAGRTC